MKFLAVLAAFVLLIGAAQARFHFNYYPSNYVRYSPGQYLLAGLNVTVQAVLGAVSSDASADYLFNQMSPMTRFVLLNQYQVQQLPYNVTDQFLKNNTDLSWQTLPANVQNLLLNEETNLAFLNLTLAQLGLVSSTSSYASYTLFQLLSPTCQALVANVSALTNQINFATKVNVTALVENLSMTNPFYGYRYGGSRGFSSLFGAAFSTPTRTSSQLARLYNYLNSGAANSRCHLGAPLGVIGEIAEFCFYPPRRWYW